ncbi:sulfonate ABC transporter permease [Paenibacillus marchantiophytorum]|uniref:Sulfonate ABC transporter permease n=1 Tax=Paenibacillus marchantiophytorum TaxID=1619310 RepID=A0ABQ2BQI4_9BACL|nr:ABC transporter permease [Paenibacillus marchantiophytorum]GGI45217.1 sulfonate ABC transporter permease [Paenibacillus marchantiophytorum]
MSRQGQLVGVELDTGQKRPLTDRQVRVKQRIYRTLLGALVPIIVLIAWQVLGQLGIISSLLFPTPIRIISAGIRLIQTGELYDNIKISVVRALSGFVLGGSLGLAFGIFVGLFRKTERALDPTVQMIRMVPHLAIAPLFILWFGIGETAKVLLIAKGAFFPLYINAFLGIRGVDNKLFDVTRVLGFSKWKQIIRLTIPGALPHILLGVRISLGVSWLGLVVAELMGSTSGIGYMMSDARQFSKTPVVFVGILIFAVFGIVADSAVRLLERKWLSWQDSYKGR